MDDDGCRGDFMRLVTLARVVAAGRQRDDKLEWGLGLRPSDPPAASQGPLQNESDR